MEKFKSKIDLSLLLFLSLIFGGIFIKSVYDEVWTLTAIMLFTIVFMIHLFSTTFYVIENEKLIIKCGFLINVSIDIQNIKKISESYNIMSSPALSFDRLEILYNKFDTILVSPKEKERFIVAIQKINPQIEIKAKTKNN